MKLIASGLLQPQYKEQSYTVYTQFWQTTWVLGKLDFKEWSAWSECGTPNDQSTRRRLSFGSCEGL